MTIKELKEAAGKATPGEWRWLIHDHSMASLGVGDDPGMGTPLVLSVSPCRSCADRAKAKGAEWEWGRCATPSEANARWLALANPSTILSLIARVEQMEEALRGARERFAQIECAGFSQNVQSQSELAEYRAALASSGFNETSSALALETPANPIEEVVDATRQD